MTPQNLNGYLNGERRPGRLFISRLSSLGYDISAILHPSTHTALPEAPSWEAQEGPLQVPSNESPRSNRAAHPPLDIEAAEFVLGRSLERAAPQFGATPSEVQAWRAGAEPTLEQMVRLTNLVLFIATDGRLNLKVPSECPSSTPAVEESRHQLTGT